MLLITEQIAPILSSVLYSNKTEIGIFTITYASGFEEKWHATFETDVDSFAEIPLMKITIRKIGFGTNFWIRFFGFEEDFVAKLNEQLFLNKEFFIVNIDFSMC
jgi:hypothetical protein